MSQLNRGFTLITALFLLTVVALLSVYMITIRNVQQSTIVFGLQGARAMKAAQAGLEWGIYRAMPPSPQVPSCLTTNPTFSAPASVPALSAFTIELDCIETSHFEGATEIIVYQLTSTAQTGTYGTLDYVYRSLQATVSAQPP